MASCRQCKKKFPFFSIRNMRHSSPFGNGYLCGHCFRPYGLVLKKYTENLKNIDTDPRAAAWVALCCLLTARRVNIARTITAALLGITEKQNSWEACRQKALELASGALALLPVDSEGRIFLKGVQRAAQKINGPPAREIRLQKYASVWGDSIAEIEYEALARSGVSLEELERLVDSLPGHQWLIS